MKNKVIKINRLWHGFCSIRDYQVAQAKKNKQGLEVWWGSDFIHIPFEDLDKCFENDEMFRSKHKDGQHYKLLDYDWVTFHRKTPIQQTLL